jgi:hypothetical protein
MVFHEVSLTITDFVRKKFKGKELICIPRYNNLPIRPDIISVLKFRKNEKYIMGWLIGECKVGKVDAADFRQALHYASISQAYEAYLFFTGVLSKEVTDSVKVGGHLYLGTNRWGKPVRKRLIFVKYDGVRFIKSIF